MSFSWKSKNINHASISRFPSFPIPVKTLIPPRPRFCSPQQIYGLGSSPPHTLRTLPEKIFFKKRIGGCLCLLLSLYYCFCLYRQCCRFVFPIIRRAEKTEYWNPVPRAISCVQNTKSPSFKEMLKISEKTSQELRMLSRSLSVY